MAIYLSVFRRFLFLRIVRSNLIYRYGRGTISLQNKSSLDRSIWTAFGGAKFSLDRSICIAGRPFVAQPTAIAKQRVVRARTLTGQRKVSRRVRVGTRRKRDVEEWWSETETYRSGCIFFLSFSFFSPSTRICCEGTNWSTIRMHARKQHLEKIEAVTSRIGQ